MRKKENSKNGSISGHDIATVLWKEMKELMTNALSKRGRIGLLVYISIFGIFLPLQGGREWIETPVGIASWVWLPFILTSGVIADSIAGERERHTLETLLASRLSDGSVLFGKIFAAVLYACIQIWLIALAAALTINIVHPAGGFVFYSPVLLAVLLLLPIMLGLLAAGIGTLVSIGAETARQAAQIVSLSGLVLLIPFFLLNVLPQSLRDSTGNFLLHVEWPAVAVAAVICLIAADVILLLTALKRFSRHKLLA